MNSTQETIQDFKRVIKRRKSLLFITPLLFVALSYGVLQFIESQYESSISIQIQEENTLNTFMMDDMNEDSGPSEEKLSLFEDFIHSRSTIEMLIDSLNMDSTVSTEKEKQQLVSDLRSRIEITSETSDLYVITFFDSDPVRARDAARLLGTFFIDTRLRMQQRRSSETVEFFNTKLEELEKVIDNHRENLVSSTNEQMEETPINSEALQSRLQSINSRAEELDWQMYQTENRISIIQEFLEREEGNFNVQPLYRLPLEEIAPGTGLSELLEEYEELNQQFTESYPRLQTLRSRITEAAKRILPMLESQLERLNKQQEEFNSQRSEVMNDMQQSFVAEQRSSSQQSNIGIYQDLYSEMKVNLEQARMSRDISDRASDRFQIVDAPFVADSPSSPDRKIVLAVGLILGFIVGGLLISVAELLDNTIRTEEDIKEFKKPVIAYLNDGKT